MVMKVKMNETSLGCMPYDLLFEILCRLPLTSLCRFKCVSMAWFSLLKSPVFCDKFHSKTPSQPFQWVFGSWGDRNVEIYSVDRRGFTTLEETHHLEREPFEVKFCDGLICCSLRYSSWMFIYNPTTKEYVRLPYLYSNISGHPMFGFGFDPSSNKYKVLSWKEDKGNLCDFQVIGLGPEGVDLMWRSLPAMLNIGQLMGEPILASGSLFWLRPQNGDQQITSFNLATEKFRMISLPNNREINGFITHTLFVSQDTLYLAEQPEPRRTLGGESLCHLNILNIWMLKDIVNVVWVTFVSNVTLPMEGTTLRDYYFGIGSIRVPNNARFSIGSSEIVILANDHRHQYLFVYCFLSGFKRIKLKGQPLPGITLRYHVKNHVMFNTNYAIVDF